jgi:hypothetical protein
MSRLTLLGLVPRDALRSLRRDPVDASAREPFDPEDALRNAVGWLCRSHDVTSREGSSKGYSLLRGWLPAYPETTGYVLGTLLRYAERTEDAELVDRAQEMGRWEVAIQEPDGGIMEGHVETKPRRSIVFNTGMVLHGWEDLAERGHDGYGEAAGRAVDFLVDAMDPDGTWDPKFEYAGIPHTYNSRVAWAMIRWGLRTGSGRAQEAASRQLDWVCKQQDASGWFSNCTFKPDGTPSTHGIAYTLRGLLESHALLNQEQWLEAAALGASAMVDAFGRQPLLVANYERGWQPGSRYACLTGTVQLGGVFLRLHALTGEDRFLSAGRRAVEQGAAFQNRRGPDDIRGALAGSFPIWGRYAPLQYPNWATKFLADSLMLYRDAEGRTK